jgi:hypothetical protein
MSDIAPSPIGQIQQAINDHDVSALTACFGVDYRNETPAHPARGFVGREQVRRNWTHILAAVPDIRADLVRWAAGPPAEPRTVWVEWDWRGTRAEDGSDVRLRGVTVLGIGAEEPDQGEVVRWARFYMESVDDDCIGAGEAVRRTVGSIR